MPVLQKTTQRVKDHNKPSLGRRIGAYTRRVTGSFSKLRGNGRTKRISKEELKRLPLEQRREIAKSLFLQSNASKSPRINPKEGYIDFDEESYKNWYSFRYIDPNKFNPKGFEDKEGKTSAFRTIRRGENFQIIFGKLKGQKTTTTQAWRYHKRLAKKK